MAKNKPTLTNLGRKTYYNPKKKPQIITYKKVNDNHNPNIRKAIINESRKKAIRKLALQLEQQAIALKKATNTTEESRIFYRIKNTTETLEIVILF